MSVNKQQNIVYLSTLLVLGSVDVTRPFYRQGSTIYKYNTHSDIVIYLQIDFCRSLFC